MNRVIKTENTIYNWADKRPADAAKAQVWLHKITRIILICFREMNKNLLTLRAGYSYGSEVVPNTQALFNVLAPAVTQEHFTFGFSKKFASDNEFHAAVMYAPEEKVHGSNPNTGPQTGHLFMDQWELELGWVFKL